MTTLLTIAFGILFFALLMASVALHEVGHMLPAKLFGVRVPKYFVGFGKTLWSIRRGETEYGFKLWPLGGFVQLLGMYAPSSPKAKPGWLTRLADEAREVEGEDITEADRSAGRLFYQQKTWKKLVMMAGGITMNLLICFALMWGINGLHGLVRPQTTVGSVPACIIATPRADMSTCLASDPPTPAKQAGIVAGDRIVAFNGIAITSYPQLQGLIRANMDNEVTLQVERGGALITLPTVHSIIRQVPDTLDSSRTVAAGFFGVNPRNELVKGGPDRAVADMWDMTAQSAVTLAQFPVKVWNVAADMVSGKPRDINGPLSIVGASAIAGEVAVSEASVGDKVVTFAGLLASVNLFLAVFNLIPLPPLDGGHIVGALYEAIKRRGARLLGRADPGFADTARMLPVAYAVGAFLLLCGIVLIVADFVSPMKLF